MKNIIWLAFLYGTVILNSGCVFETCQVFTVLAKSKCTFDREEKARVCVVKLGKIENQAVKSIRGRTVSTILPEPLEPYLTQVEMCVKEGKEFSINYNYKFWHLVVGY